MEDQYFSVSKGDLLTTKSSTYLVEDFLGEGTFGKVARCVETATNQKVAVKIIKNHPDLLPSVKQEVFMLKYLRALDPDLCGIVRWMGTFNHGPHPCLVFELLEQSLYDFVRQRPNHKLPVMQIRPIVEQLASALNHIGNLGIIHGDLKPQNIMMTGQDTRVKIIDFGVSLHVSQAEVGSSLGTLWYRSPEIMLGLPYTGISDMWSLGCLTAELLIGSPIYPGRTEHEMWAYIIDLQGHPPDGMLNRGTKSHLYFLKEGYLGVWRIKAQCEYEKTVGRKGLKRHRPRRFFTSLKDVVKAQTGPPFQPNFVDLLKRMLQLDCDQRITTHALLAHPFIRMWSDIETICSFPELTMVQPCSTSHEPSVDQPHSSCPETSVDPPHSSCTETSVDPPHSSCTETSLDQPHSSRTGSSWDQPPSSTPEPSVDQPTGFFPDPIMVQPPSGFPESSWELPFSIHPEPSLELHRSSCPEPMKDQPYSSSREPSVDQPKGCFPELMMVQPCSLPASHTPSGPEEQREAMVNTTDSGQGTIPTACYRVATETEEVKPAVAEIPLEVTPKKKEKKHGRVKRFFKTVLKSFCCCCCSAHGDQD